MCPEVGALCHSKTTSLDIYAKSRHSCDRDFITIQCLKCGHNRVVATGSRDRTCPACSKEIFNRVYERYEKVIGETKNLKFLTLTWKPVRHQSREVLSEMGRALNRFLHRRPYRSLWTGVLAVVECKKTPTGLFYYHIHCLVTGSYVPQAQISEDWSECSGFPIVWIKRIWRTPKRALRYVLKYVFKGFSFDDPKDRRDFKKSMKGTHYVRSYGEYYRLYRSSGHVYFPCPDCGSVKCWLVLDFCSIVDLSEREAYDPHFVGWD